MENENGYFRRNHFVPVPSVRNLEELNSFLLAECQKDEQRIIHGRSVSRVVNTFSPFDDGLALR